MPQPVISFRRSYEFGVGPAALWSALERVDEFERLWPWLEDFSIDGDGLRTGAVLHGVVAPPLPYRMRLTVVLDRCEPPTAIDATVSGDLRGQAQLRLDQHGDGTLAAVEWTVEMMQRPMRLASRVAHPVLQWGHDRVVDMTVSGFRRRLERP